MSELGTGWGGFCQVLGTTWMASLWPVMGPLDRTLTWPRPAHKRGRHTGFVGRYTEPESRRAVLALKIAAASLVGAAALGTVLTMAWAAGVGQPGWAADPAQLLGLLFIVWNLLPHAWALGLIRSVRSAVRAAAVVAAGSLVFAAVNAYFLFSFVVSESSTSALVFVSLPVVLGLVVAPTHLLVVVMQRRASRVAA